MEQSTARLSQRLRTATAELHAHLEQLPFFQALEQGTLQRESYIGLLRALALVHAALETACEGATHPALHAVWRPSMRRLPALERDLQELDAARVAPEPLAMLHARMLSEHLAACAQRQPEALVGALYVLEGATLGSPIVRAWVRRTFALEQAGVRYLSSYDDHAAERWRSFTRRLDAAVPDAAAQAPAIALACAVFTALARIVEALHPLGARPPHALLHALNPEAGHHPITEEWRELEAALRAGERSWRDCPYYAARYGERGQRFTRSDSAWLAGLTRHAPPVIEHQIAWLARLLAARGMPRWLLECHLFVLADELTQALPEHAQRYARLAQAAHKLRAERLALLDEADFINLAARLEAQLMPDRRQHLANIGRVLVAAVLDDEAGIAHALSSVEAWLCDPQRFDAPWCAAVRDTIAATRHLVQQRRAAAAGGDPPAVRA